MISRVIYSNPLRNFQAALLVIPFGVIGCQTVSDQAPLELKAAQEAIEAAEDVDVEDYMPSAMEAAQRKFDASLTLLDESANYQDDGNEGQAKGTREEAIKLANEAKLIADGSVKLVKDMRAYDSNSGEYLSLAERTGRVAALETEIATLKGQYGEVKGQNSELATRNQALASENQDLSKRPTEAAIPADFRVGKPVAYFASGSTVLAARYRPEIQQLAELLRNNKNLAVTLEGYADPRGSAELNQRLAEERLNVVAEQLKSQGVEAERVKTVTVGATADSSAARGASRGELQLDRKVTATISAH